MRCGVEHMTRAGKRVRVFVALGCFFQQPTLPPFHTPLCAQEAADTLLRQLEDDLHVAARSVEESTRQVSGPLALAAF